MRVNTNELGDYAKALARIRKKALLHAARQTLNDLAQTARQEANEEIGASMVIRNKWTQSGTRYTKARGSSIQALESFAGSVRDYMAEQERGGTKSNPILPTGVASGEGMVALPRRKVWQRRYDAKRVQNWSALPKNLAKTEGRRKKQRLVVTAKTRTTRQVFWDGRIWLMGGGRARRRRRGMTKLRLRMTHDLRHGQVAWDAIPWLDRATDKAMGKARGFALRRLREEFQRAMKR